MSASLHTDARRATDGRIGFDSDDETITGVDLKQTVPLGRARTSVTSQRMAIGGRRRRRSNIRIEFSIIDSIEPSTMFSIPSWIGVITMTIEFDRRHAFYFDTDGDIRPFSPYRLDQLWRSEPDAALPELANQRIRFAVLHIERLTSQPHVVIEYYPVLTLDTDGNVDLEIQQAQLHAEVDRLEATGYPRTTTHESETTWQPDPATRDRLIAATRPSYRTRMTDVHLPRAEERRPNATYGRAHRCNDRRLHPRLPSTLRPAWHAP